MATVSIDSEEMAVLIAEGCMGNTRPAGMSAAEALDQLEALSPESVAGFRRAALVVAEYIARSINGTNPGKAGILRGGEKIQ